MILNSHKAKLNKSRNYKPPKINSRIIKVYNKNRSDINIEMVDLFLAVKDHSH